MGASTTRCDPEGVTSILRRVAAYTLGWFSPPRSDLDRKVAGVSAGVVAPQVDIRRAGYVEYGSARSPRPRRVCASPRWCSLAASSLVGGGCGSRSRLVTTRRQRSRPSRRALLIDAEQLYVDLADADATASRVPGGWARVGHRTQSIRGEPLGGSRPIGTSSETRSVLIAATQQAVAVVSEGLPEYASSVATARVNNRLGHPVGAAYLRQASDQMRNRILPRGDQDLPRRVRSHGERLPVRNVVAAGRRHGGRRRVRAHRAGDDPDLPVPAHASDPQHWVGCRDRARDRGRRGFARPVRQRPGRSRPCATRRFRPCARARDGADLGPARAERLDACGDRPSIHR